MDSIFKRTLRSELDFQDITVKELARQTQISQRTIEGYLSARGSIPPADVAVKIAQVLNVSVEYLVTGNATFNSEKMPQTEKLANEIATMNGDKKIFLKNFIELLNDFKVER